MSDYTRGKMEAEVWADRMSRFLDKATASNSPLGRASEYRAVIRVQMSSHGLPPGVEFTDRILRKTDYIIRQVLPVHQREELIAFLFAEVVGRETSTIKAIYKKIGRELRE